MEFPLPLETAEDMSSAENNQGPDVSSLVSPASFDAQVDRVQHLVDRIIQYGEKYPELRGMAFTQLADKYPTEIGDVAAEIGATTFCWACIGPRSESGPPSRVYTTVEDQYGSWDEFRDEFLGIVDETMGGRRVTAAFYPALGTVQIVTSQIGEPLAADGTIPLFSIDACSHAYWMDYGADLDAYARDWWDHVNWDHTARIVTEHFA